MSKRATTMLTGTAALLAAVCLSEARAGAQTPRTEDNRLVQNDRSRGFSGFADWDSRFGGYLRDRAAADTGKVPDRQPAAPRRDDAKGPPAFGPGGFADFGAAFRDAWRSGGDFGRGGPPFAAPGRAPTAAPPARADFGDWRRGMTSSSQRGGGAPPWAGRGGPQGRGGPDFSNFFGQQGRGGPAFGNWRGGFGQQQRGGAAWGGRGGQQGRGGPAFAGHGWSGQRHGSHRCGFSGRQGQGGPTFGNWRGGFGRQQQRGPVWGGRGGQQGRGGPAFTGRGWSGHRHGMQRHGFSSRQGRGGPAFGNWRRGFAPSPRFNRGTSGFRGFGPGSHFGFGAMGRGGMGQRFDWRDFRPPQQLRPAAPPQQARPAAPPQPAPRTPDRGRPAAPPAPPAAAPRTSDAERRIDNLLREIEELRRQLRR